MNGSAWKSLEGLVVEGKYCLKRLIGTDPDGAVFRADRIDAGRTTLEAAVRLSAVDAGRPEPRWRKLAAPVGPRHPHLVECYGAGVWQSAHQSLLYLATELAEQQLADRIRLWPLSVSQARGVVSGVASALCYLHGRPESVVHRGVRPSDIMLVGGRWKLSEFGAMPAGGPLRTEEFQDAAYYTPPEGQDGAVSPAGDIWALGVLIVRAMTGLPPFRGDPQTPLTQVIATRAPVVKMPLPAPFGEIVAGCLQKDPGSRWTAEQVLEAVAAGAPPEAAPPVSTDYRWVASAVAAAGVLVAIVMGAFLFWREPGENVSAPPSQPAQDSRFLRPPPVISQSGLGLVRGRQPRLIRRVEPDYPAAALQAGIQGTVRLRITVGQDGVVKEVRVVSGPGALASAAANAVRQWLFQPMVVGGQTVGFVTEFDLSFDLSKVDPR